MKTIAAGQFKTECLALMDEVAKTGQAILITKHRKGIAKLCPVEDSAQAALLDCLASTGRITGDLLQSLGETWDAAQ